MSAQETTEVEVAERPNVTVLETFEHPKPGTEVAQETTATETEATTTETTEEGQERNEKGQFKPKLQERIDEITRQRHEAQREAAYWRGLAEAAQPKEAPAEASEPKSEDFEDYGAYVRALAKFEAKALVKAEFEQQRTQKAQEAQATTWQQRADAAKAELPDFEKVMATSTAPMSHAMAEAIKGSDIGPKVAYHLAQNPEIADRLSRLEPMAAAREIGRLEASLSVKTEPIPKRITSAPVPPTPIGSGRSTSGEPGSMSQADYMEWRKTHLRN
tara:strand:- start:784 stop:1605 length:822 start_codon:yes stop_codon:yes gene_type:complete